MTYSIQNSREAAINQMYIQEKNAASGVFFDSTTIKTISDIKAIVANALNNNGNISIELSEAILPDIVEVSTLNEEDLKKITYTVTNIERPDPTAIYVSWSLHKTGEGNAELKFRIEGKLGGNDLSQIQDVSTQSSIVSTSLTPVVQLSTHDKLENYTTTEASFTNSVEGNANLEATTVGFAKNEVAINQMYIQEKNATSGVLFDSSTIKTMGDVRAIVTKALNIGEISLQHLGISLSNEMAVSDLMNKEKTYIVNHIQQSDPIATYFSWSAYKTAEGNRERSFRGQWKVSMTNLPQMENVSIFLPPENAIKPSRLPPEGFLKNELGHYITTEAYMFDKTQNNKNPYITTIGVGGNMRYTNGKIIMPSGSWALYIPQGETYNLFGVFPPGGYTYGNIATKLGSYFGVRIGHIRPNHVLNNLPKPPNLVGKYEVLDIALPGKYESMFNKVVVQCNPNERVCVLA